MVSLGLDVQCNRVKVSGKSNLLCITHLSHYRQNTQLQTTAQYGEELFWSQSSVGGRNCLNQILRFLLHGSQV